VRQHTLGVVGYITWVLFAIYSCLKQWKNFDQKVCYRWLYSAPCVKRETRILRIGGWCL